MRAAILLACSFVFAGPGLAGGRPASDYLSFTTDGAWCWFGDPRAVYHEGKVYAGWVDKQGSIWVAALDPQTREIRRTCLHEKLEIDDHDSPSVLVRPDGRIMVAWSRHAKGDMYLAVSRKAGDISEFDEPRRLSLNSKEANAHCYSGGQDSYTYPSLFYLRDDRTYYLGWRGLDFKPNLSWSKDGGATWAAGRIYVFPEKTYLNQRPYMKIASNGKDRLHFAFTDGHPRNEPENSIYHACLKGGQFRRADGRSFRALERVPFDVREADLVYDARKTKVKAWIWDVAEDRNGRPVIVYVRFPDDTDHCYYYARWDGTRWRDHEIARGGGWFPQTPAGETEREPNYSGGLVLDHEDPDTVYLSIPVEGVREIQKWTTADLGQTWRNEAITAGSKRDNVRPFAIRNAPAGGLQVLWMTLNSYTHYTRYDSEIKINLPSR